MRPRNIVVVVVLVAVAGGAVYAWKEYHRPPAAINALVAKESVGAAELLKAFQENEGAATSRFVGTTEQAIQVNGSIRAIGPASEGKVNVVLETGDALAGIVCEFGATDVPPDWKPGADVTVKGICTGMLLDVLLVRCAAVE